MPTVKTLRKICKKNCIKGYSKLNKAALEKLCIELDLDIYDTTDDKNKLETSTRVKKFSEASTQTEFKINNDSEDECGSVSSACTEYDSLIDCFKELVVVE